MYRDYTLNAYLEETASSSPVPGGGSIAASSGATGAALVEMVAGLTIGKKKYIDVEADMKVIQEKANELRHSLLKDIDLDAESFNKVMAAFKLPKETEDEKAARKEAIQDATKEAATVPLQVAEKSLEVIELAKEVVTKGNKNAITDGGVACIHGHSAVRSALFNVKINLLGLKDTEFVDRVKEKAEKIEAQAKEKEEEVMALVEEALKL